MLCAYECHMVGGPWIAENPECPVHGSQRDEYHQSKLDVLIRCWNREISADEALDELDYL